MSRHCCHDAEHSIRVCPHVLDKSAKEGVKRLTRNGNEAEYLCEECEQRGIVEVCYVCRDCIDQLEAGGYWQISGTPGIVHQPEPFKLSQRQISFPSIKDQTVRACIEMGEQHILLYTDNGQLMQVDLISAQGRIIAELADETIKRHGVIDLYVSQDQQFIAITSRVSDRDKSPSNRGVVIDRVSGQVLMQLDCGHYHTELTEFPVCFIEYNGQTLLIHATDWDRLDISDPRTGRCLTERDVANMPQREDALFTEWHGRLYLSPDHARIATIGWIWHPVGIAFSWDLNKWLNENIWEADNGISKQVYAIWDYFWDSPLCWLDNERLCIWGYEALHANRDCPLESVAIYEVSTGNLLNWFAGPTIDFFHFDGYLFSGTEDQQGVTVWDVEQGALLHTETRINPITYHHKSKEFIEIFADGRIVLSQLTLV